MKANEQFKGIGWIYACRKCGLAFIDALVHRLCAVCRLERKRVPSDSADGR